MKTSISVALALALVGCSAPFDWKGEWEGTMGSAPQTAVEGTVRRVQLSVRPGRDPVLTYLGFPAEGVLETSGHRATFMAKTVMGQPLSRQGQGIQNVLADIEIRVVDDNTLEATLKQPGGPVPVTLRRKAQPSPGR